MKRIPSTTVERDKPKRISIYGTGGIGKSTVSSNLSASLVLLGERVYQIGCDPKRDSISTLCGELKPTVLDELRRRNKVTPDLKMLKELVFEAKDYNERLYGTECGGPKPGKGCAGKGVHLALQFIEKYNIFKEFGITFVLYDVLGDTVCGGFATPLNFTPQTYIVTSGEVAPMVQAMKIVESVMAKASEGSHDVGIAGIINNMRGIEHEREIVEEVFGEIGLPVIHHIPRSQIVQEAENLKRTVVQSFPDSEQAKEYLELAKKIINNDNKIIIKKKVLNSLQIKEIVSKYK
jgi:nitrogenase iron protein NifH